MQTGAPPFAAFCYDTATHAVATVGLASFFALSEMVIKPRLQDSTAAADAVAPIDALLPARAHKAWRTASNVALYAALAAPGLLTPWLVSLGLPQAVGDTLMIYETACLANALTDVIKFSVRRTRPAECGLADANVERHLSFPSGHTSVVAAISGAQAVGICLRHGPGLASTAAIGWSLGLTTLTACGRVRGSMHFLSDVAGGALLGSTVGWVWPRLHRC